MEELQHARHDRQDEGQSSVESSRTFAEKRILRQRLLGVFGAFLGMTAFEYVVSFGITIALVVISFFWPEVMAWSQSESFVWVSQVVLYPLLLLLPYSVYRRTQHFSPSACFSAKPFCGSVFFLVLFTGLALCTTASFAGNILGSFLEIATGVSSSGGVVLPKNFVDLSLSFVGIVVMPALLEEYVFRGILLRTLMPYGKAFAILISSIAFAMVHSSVPQWISTFIMGLVMGYLVAKTDSIWPSVLLHFFNNALAFCQTLLFDMVGEKLFYLIYVTGTALLLLAGLVYFLFFVRRHKDFFTLSEERPRLSADIKRSLFFRNPLLYITVGVSVVSMLISATAA